MMSAFCESGRRTPLSEESLDGNLAIVKDEKNVA